MPVILDAQANRKAHITLNPDATMTAAELANLTTFLASCNAAGLSADVTLWPEPYNKGLTPDQYKQILGYYGGAVRAAGYKIAYNGGVWPGTGGSLATFTSYYPGPGLVDLVMPSFMASGYSAGFRLDDYAAVADADGLPVGLLRMGVEATAAQADGQAYMGYLRSWFAARQADGRTAADVMWDDAAASPMPGGSYLVAEWQELFDLLTGAATPPEADRPAIVAYGRPGTFAAMEDTWQTASGHTFAPTGVESWQFGGGEAIFYTAATADGKIVCSTCPLTSNELKPTMDHAELGVFDPAAGSFRRIVVPTSAGALTATTPGQSTGGTDAGGGDLIALSPTKVAFTCAGYYFGWDIAAGGMYPAVGFLAKGADWAYDQAASKTTDQARATNPTAYNVIASSPTSGNNGTYYAGRGFNQLDVTPQSGRVVICHYWGNATYNSGVISVWDQSGNLLAAAQIPNMNRQDGATAVYMCPREIKCDPSSAANDERFVIIYDVYEVSGNGAPSPPHVAQEWAYNETTKAIAAKSVPFISGQDDAQPAFCCFAADGTLYVGNIGAANGLLARNCDVYVKTGGERPPVTLAPATGAWATNGSYATKVAPDLSLGFPEAQSLGMYGPLAYDPATAALAGPSWSGKLALAAHGGGYALGANLLTGDTKDFEGGTVGSWAAPGLYLTILANSTTYAHGGTHSLRVTSGFAMPTFGCEAGPFPVTAGQEYRASGWATRDAGAPAAAASVAFAWLDSAGTQIGYTTRATRTAQISGSGNAGWVQPWAAAAAPAGATQCKIVAVCAAGSNVTVGQGYHWDDFALQAQPFTMPLPTVDLGVAAMRAGYPSMFPGRPSLAGGKLWIPWAVTFTNAENAAFVQATYVPDLAHPQFLMAVDLALVAAGGLGTITPGPPEPPPPDPGGGPAPVIPPAPVARRDWHFVLGPASGGHESELGQAAGRTVTFRLIDAHEAVFQVNAAAGYDEGIAPLATDLHIIRAGEILFRGRVGPSTDTLKGGAHKARFTAGSYRGLLDRRRLYASSQLAWTNADVGEIAWGLVQQTQARPGGNLGIVKGRGIPLGITGSKTCEAGDAVAERIDDLAYVDASYPGAGGFDWDVTPADAYSQTLDLWPIARGTDRGVFLQYGDGLTGDEWQIDVDPAGFADALRMAGGGDAPPAPVEVAAADIAARPEGRWDAAYLTDEADPDRLAARAALQLQVAGQIWPSYTIPLRPGVWGGPGHIWLGDPVRVFVGSGRWRTLVTGRVVEMPVTLTAAGEQVAVTVGAPRPDLRRKLAAAIRELQYARKQRRK